MMRKKMNNLVKNILKDFWKGLSLCLYLIIKLDNFLFHMVVLCFIPILFLVQDFLSWFRFYIWFWLYQRFLYILSNGRYGYGIWFNKWLSIWYSIRGLSESLFIYGGLLHRSIFLKIFSFFRKLPARWDNFFEETIHIYKYAIPSVVIKFLLYFFFRIYIWFTVPSKELRLRLINKTFFSHYVFTFVEFYSFKDENMHPTFKTTWPLILDWFFDFLVELHESDFDDLEMQDKDFAASVAYKRGRRIFWLNFINNLSNKFVVYLVKPVSVFLLFLFLSLYNIYTLFLDILIIFFYSVTYILNSCLYLLILIYYYFNLIKVNALRFFTQNYFLYFIYWSLTLFFGFWFFLELLYIGSPFVARAIIFFYNPFGYLAMSILILNFIPLYILKTLFPSWQGTWEESGTYIFLLAMLVPWSYAGWIFEGDTPLTDIVRSPLHELVHYKLYRYILWDPFFTLIKIFYNVGIDDDIESYDDWGEF